MKQEWNNQDPLRKIRWSKHTPFGQRSITKVRKFLLPMTQDPMVKALLYMGGGAVGMPKGVKISQKVDIWNHVNLSVLFESNTMDFIIVLAGHVQPDEVPSFVDHYDHAFNSH